MQELQVGSQEKGHLPVCAQILLIPVSDMSTPASSSAHTQRGPLSCMDSADFLFYPTSLRTVVPSFILDVSVYLPSSYRNATL